MGSPKDEARRLRARGLTLRQIADTLGMSLGTVGYWCRDISAKQTRRKCDERLARLQARFAPLFGWRIELGLPRTPRSRYVTPELRERVAKGLSRDPDGRLAYDAVRLYVDEGLSTPEIGARLGFTSVTIADWLRKAGVEIRRSPTLRTRRKLREANLGEKRYNWKGGAKRKALRMRLSLEMRVAREACFGRDDYTCQSCGVRGGKLNAHHVWPFSRFPDWKFEPWNLVTLCEQCHRDFHNSAGGAVRMAIGPFFLNGVRKVKEESAPYEVRPLMNLRIAA